MELLPFVDVLKVFNNPINEEQAWAVCYQCVNFLLHNQNQEYYQFVFDYGIHSIWLSRQGDVLLRKRPPDPNGSGKELPQQNLNSPHSSSVSTTVLSKRKRHVIATETDAVQALGTAIFEALDYGIDASEERQLSQGLESLIVTMTNADNSLEYDPDVLNADDEGIEKDADIDLRCSIQDVIKLCSQHLSSKQDAQHHYKAVCRALATEAGELFTFLEKIVSCKEKLSETLDEDTRRLEELQQADWACLWVQVMRSLRQGVSLKKVEHVNLPPVEYELTPFEILLEDIRSHRYTLHKIMVNGDIPHKVKDNAQAVILDFIRSRPPLKKVNERKLKPKPPPDPDPHERLLKDIRSQPKLKPVRDGKLVVGASGSRLSSDDDDIEPPRPAKRVIKPDLNLFLNNSFEESSEDEDHLTESSLTLPLSTVTSNMTPPLSSWQRSDAFMQDGGSGHPPSRLQRRHTIMVCESSMDRMGSLQELPPLEEEEEPSPVRENHQFSQNSLSNQTHGLAGLSRISYSDNDLSSQVTMRHPPGHLKRSSLEHRRSLTSLSTELCAIPEMEDGLGGTDSPTKSASSLIRSWSHEQAPPPNPSPPCKGRARTVLGTSMKSVGSTYHPGTHRLQTSLASQNLSTNQSVSSTMATNSTPTTISSFHSSHQGFIYPSNETLPVTDPVTSSLSSPLVSSSSNNLDPTVSAQSPGYIRKIRISQNPAVQNGQSSVGNAGLEHPTERLRYPAARVERFNSKKHVNTRHDDVDNNTPVSEYHHSQLAKGDIQPRRLSLESGVGMYKDGANQVSGVAGFDKRNKTSKRLSLGMKKKGREEGTGVPVWRLRSPDEEDRLKRWRMLQEEDLALRTRKIGRDMTSQHCEFSEEQTEHISQKHFQPHNHNTAPTQQTSSTQKMDVFQQKMADEEARFARWRHLEETGQFGVHPDEDISRLSSPNKDDVLSARLQPANFVTPTSNITSVHGNLPLPKRWQNPVECLSLTLEEVTHIRTVLTKAELESLLSHPDLYQQVSKSKLCFTCKTTRFTLFGEWGTKCKFCKRTVCSKCLRKMNVPTDQFKQVPVYSLSTSPLTPEMQECVQKFIKTGSSFTVQPTDVSGSRRNTALSDQVKTQHEQPSESSTSSEDDPKNSKELLNRSKPLQRSQSLFVSGHKQGSGTQRAIKGPSMAICCDCKGMVKEIIRATQASLAILSSSGSSTAISPSSVRHLPSMSRNLSRN